MAKTKPFKNHLAEYEQWFEDNIYVYKSELMAIRRFIPNSGRGVEVGVGSGLFASKLDIKEGCDPSKNMLNLAAERGIEVTEGCAEKLPYMSESFDFALMVTTICFVDDVHKSLEEIRRILKPGGFVIIGFVDKNSPVGKIYLAGKDKSIFYKDAIFFSTQDIYNYLWEHDFEIAGTLQTVFGKLDEIDNVQEPKKEYGEGSFVVIKAIKKE